MIDLDRIRDRAVEYGTLALVISMSAVLASKVLPGNFLTLCLVFCLWVLSSAIGIADLHHVAELRRMKVPGTLLPFLLGQTPALALVALGTVQYRLF